MPLPEEQAVVRVQVRAKVGIARGEHRPNLSPETRESEARNSRPSQSTFHEHQITEDAPRGDPPPPETCSLLPIQNTATTTSVSKQMHRGDETRRDVGRRRWVRASSLLGWGWAGGFLLPPPPCSHPPRSSRTPVSQPVASPVEHNAATLVGVRKNDRQGPSAKKTQNNPNGL